MLTLCAGMGLPATGFSQEEYILCWEEIKSRWRWHPGTRVLVTEEEGHGESQELSLREVPALAMGRVWGMARKTHLEEWQLS